MGNKTYELAKKSKKPAELLQKIISAKAFSQRPVMVTGDMMFTRIIAKARLLRLK